MRETRARILSGEQAIESLVNEHVGEINAHIVERAPGFGAYQEKTDRIIPVIALTRA